MNNQRLISFDIQADFGFFKKPDYNDGVLLTYNMLHKPALLGILGAIIGLRGYQKKGEWPEYYQRLAPLQRFYSHREGSQPLVIFRPFSFFLITPQTDNSPQYA